MISQLKLGASMYRMATPMPTNMLVIAKRLFSKNIRPFKERNRVLLAQHKNKRLSLALRSDKPSQFNVPDQPPEPKVIRKERRLPSLVESKPQYKQYSQEAINRIENFETYYDPLFNPHLHEERNRVNPDEEPFNAIYSDSKSPSSEEYTKVRDITSPELWEYVERLARLTIAPQPRRRKVGEPVEVLPSGFVPPPESPPDLPYFVARTRNHLLPVYYHISSDPEKCITKIKQVTGDLWKFEEDLRTHLESLKNMKILSSVQETDELIAFRGRYIHEVVDWLHAKGF